MKLNERQVKYLKSVARPKYLNYKLNTEFGKKNDDLENVISLLKYENPMVFLTDSDLKHRVFYHKPKFNPENIIECAGYLEEFIPLDDDI